MLIPVRLFLLLALVLGLVGGGRAAIAAVSIKKAPDGYAVKAEGYKAHLGPQGWLDRLEVGRLAPIRAIALGEMGKKGYVFAQQAGDSVTFDERGIYHLVYQFREDGFRASATITERAAARDGTDGKWYFLWFKVLFGPDAQLVKVIEPAALQFSLPVRTARAADRFAITLSDGTQIELATSGDTSFPNDPGGFGSSGVPPYGWQRGYMKLGKEYQYNFTITPGKKGQAVLAAPAATIQCERPDRRTTPGGPLAFLLRIAGEDALRLGKQVKSMRVDWKVIDFFGRTVYERPQPLKIQPGGTDLVSAMSAPVERAGWFRVEAVLEDRSKRMVPSRSTSDYAVVMPGVLPEIPAGNKDLVPGINLDLSAWLGFGLERIGGDFSAALPAAAASARRSGMQFFFQFTGPPKDVQSADQFGEYVGKVVAEHRSSCKHWEMINEPQATVIMTPEKYVAYLKAGYQAAKLADPECKVLGPTVCGIDLGYIEAVYKLGGGKFFDILTVHPYTGHGRGWVEQGIEVQYRALRALMARYGDEKKEVWFTESGFQNIFWITPIPEVQARFIVQEFLLGDSWGMPKSKVAYFFLKDHGFENWYVVRGDNSLSPAAAGMRNYAQQIHGLEFAGLLDVGRNRFAMHYRGPKRQLVALFSYDFPTRATLATDAQKGIVADFFGNREAATIEDGQVSVPVSGYPTYVLLPPQASVRGVPEDMGENLALKAPATASSGQASAAQATDGITTANGDHAGLPGWVSDKGVPLPQWLEVTLPKPSRVARVIVYTNSCFCGPAGIRDYQIQVRQDDKWRTVASESGNVDRWVLEHRFEPVLTDKVRVLVTRVNNGGLRDDPRKYTDLVARVAEIEVYAK
jgi:hypothetical protein